AQGAALPGVERRQEAGEVDRQPGVEVDRERLVGDVLAVGVDDRLPQRPGTAVVTVSDAEDEIGPRWHGDEHTDECEQHSGHGTPRWWQRLPGQSLDLSQTNAVW